uniref:Uncharacterized protein n=1 Tax=Opuntia streptacantha TaxID=393608 RepID=A0A7C9AY48_OPUST
MGSSTAHAFQAKRIRPAVFSLSQSGRLWPFSLHSSVSLFFDDPWSDWIGDVGQRCCFREVLRACSGHRASLYSGEKSRRVGLWLRISWLYCSSFRCSCYFDRSS